MELEYIPVRTAVTDERNEIAVFYGVRVLDGKGNSVLELPKLSLNRKRVARLVKLLRDNRVEVNHIGDVIDDFFCG